MSVFFSSRKTNFIASSSPLRHLLDTWLSVELPSFFLSQSRHLLDTWWVDRESSCPLDSFSTPGGLIKPHLLCLMFCTSTLPRHLYLSTTKSSTFGSTPWSTPLDTFFCRDLLRFYIFFSCNPNLNSLDVSLDSSVSSPPNPLSLSHSKPLPSDSSSFFKFSFNW